MSFSSRMESLRESIQQIKVSELDKLSSLNPIYLDIRDQEEVSEGIIPGAICISKGFLEAKIESLIKDKNKRIIVYCAAGTRSLFGAEALGLLGYKNVYSLDGGIDAWKSSGFLLEIPESSSDFHSRYKRHILVPEIGLEGQLKLKKAKVLVVGLGGLGCPAAMYLAAAGVGTIGIIDDDVVSLSNLQRQTLHGTSTIGMSKVESAKSSLYDLNPDIVYNTYQEKLSESNIDKIVPEYDIVLDGCDNFNTRYLVNDACIKHGVVNVFGSINQFKGQVSVFNYQDGPCYRCVFPEPPPKEFAPNCAEAGVLGVLPGTVGVLEATEAIKVILGLGEVTSGRIIEFDALSMNLEKLNLFKNPMCLCNSSKEKISYESIKETCELGG